MHSVQTQAVQSVSFALSALESVLDLVVQTFAVISVLAADSSAAEASGQEYSQSEAEAVLSSAHCLSHLASVSVAVSQLETVTEHRHISRAVLVCCRIALLSSILQSFRLVVSVDDRHGIVVERLTSRMLL